MKLTISEAAQHYLTNKLGAGATFLLTLNDGSNQFSSAGGTCMIGDKYQIVSLPQPVAPYTIQLANQPFNVYISEYEKMFLGQAVKLAINPSSATLVLKDETGLLDNNLLINQTFVTA